MSNHESGSRRAYNIQRIQGCIKPISVGRRRAALDDCSGHWLWNPISLADAETATTAKYRRTEPSGATPGPLGPLCPTPAVGPTGAPASLPEERPSGRRATPL